MVQRFGPSKATVLGWQDVTVHLALTVDELPEYECFRDLEAERRAAIAAAARRRGSIESMGSEVGSGSEDDEEGKFDYLLGCTHVCEVQLQLADMAAARDGPMITKPTDAMHNTLAELLADVPQRDTLTSFIWSQLNRVMTSGDSGSKKKRGSAESFMTEAGELPFRQYHEFYECSRRQVPCPLKCGELVHYDELEKHVKDECVKRPVPPMPCRLGCGKMFYGGAWRLLELEEERLQHEMENAPSAWCQLACQARRLIKAKERTKVRTDWIDAKGGDVYNTRRIHVRGIINEQGCIDTNMGRWGR